AVAARHYVVVAAVRRMRDAEPPGGRASELAGEGRGDVPLERAAEGADARVVQPAAAPGDALAQAGVDQEPKVARRDGAARVAGEVPQAQLRAVLQHVAQEETVGVVAQQRVVPLTRVPGARHEQRRRVALAVPREPAAAERRPHRLLARAEA